MLRGIFRFFCGIYCISACNVASLLESTHEHVQSLICRVPLQQTVEFRWPKVYLVATSNVPRLQKPQKPSFNRIVFEKEEENQLCYKMICRLGYQRLSPESHVPKTSNHCRSENGTF